MPSRNTLGDADTTDTADEQRSLDLHLLQKVTAMREAAARRPEADDWQAEVSAECVADDLTGVRKLRIRDWKCIGDGGPDIGGWDLGPTSPELLCGVVATCLTHTYLCLAATRELSLHRVAVRVTAQNNDAHFFGVESDRPTTPYGITAHVSILAPDLSVDELAAFVDEGQATCPILQLLRTPNPVEVVAEPAAVL